MLSTYPPTPCGLATFAEALVGGFSALGTEVDVVRVVDEHQTHRPARVAEHWVVDSAGPAARAHPTTGTGAVAAALNRYDVVIVQHEYGIYGGSDGESVLSLLRQLHVPVITVLHTVLSRPTTRQHRILSDVVGASSAVVTMTWTARARAIELYGARPDMVHVIPHGAADGLLVGTPETGRRATAATAPVVLTWGLLGRGKGIEWAIRAMATLQDLRPPPTYVVAGRTHPRLCEADGTGYRRELVRLADDLGVSATTVFDDRYLDPAALHALVRGADVVLLPYDSLEQVTSGVLTEAVAAGKPVISSRFPHAVELLGDGAGLLVERGDADGIARALRRVLTEPLLAERLSGRAEHLSPGLSWRSVAGEYLHLTARLRRRPPAAHIRARHPVGAHERPHRERSVVA
ncbi:MAG: glycosyltransferase [Kineosporiaceae bacterium]|jgi:glycosyltransferase involved in cell wall biosynthesis